MATAPGLLGMGEEYVLPSSNSSKPYQYLVEVIGLDHCYSKPWSSQQRVPNPRPVKTLFFRDAENALEPKRLKENKLKSEEMIIDVDSVDDVKASGPSVINMQYDVSKSKIAMGECERFVSTASSRKTPDTWEELICRTGWTNQQSTLFDKILKVVSSYRLARLTYEGSANEPVLRRIAVDKATKRVRQILSRIRWDTKLTTWLHNSMVDGLSIPLLGCYLDILQTLRSKVPTLVDQMVASPTSHRRVSAGTSDNMTSLLKRPWDATIGLSSFQRQRKVSGPPLLLIVPSGPTTNSTGNTSKRSRFWHHHLSNLGKVIPVTMHLSNGGRGVSIGQCLDHMIGAVQAKVLELKNHFPNRPVVLIGWSTGALVSFQVSLVEPVCALVCLGFPLLGLEGIRGDTDDPFLECKTPTMFVFGSLSSCCSLSDIEEFRKKLLTDTSLLVIGGADDQLRLTCTKKKIEGVTQSMVDRRIMDEIGEFLGSAVSAMNSVQNRSDYFDFDDIESRRKKPKNEKRKRPAANGTSSAGGEEVTKKPRNKVTKPAAPRVQGNISKKTKSVKSVKRASLSKPVILAPGTTLIPGPRSSLPSRNIALSTLPNNAPTNSGGIIQGVTVPISGVNAPISGVNVPVSAVNVPVSAVIKQGSLGGRSFVFSCPQQANSSATSAGLVAPACVMTSGDGGDAQHLKIVMNSSPGSLTKVPEQKNMATVTSPLRQPIVQYKSNVVTSALGATSTNPTAASTTIGSVVSPGLVSSKTATTVAKDSERGTLVTSPAVTSSMTVSSVTHKTLPGNPSPVARRVVSTSAVVSTPSSRTTVVPSSSQAQFIMRKGQLSTINKPGGVRVSVPPAVNVKSAQGPQVQRGATPANGSRAVVRSSQGTSQQTSTTKSDGSAKDSTTNLPVSSQAVTALLRKTPSPQTVTRTIQVGVKDPKKPLLTKRTVTYSPSTSTRSVSVVSRTVPSSFVGGIVTRTPTSSSNGQTLIPTTSTYRLSAQLKNLQDLGKQSMTTPLPGTQLASTQSKNVQQLIKQSVTTPVVSAQLKNVQRSSPQLVSASPATARSVHASSPSASSTAAQKSSTQSVSALETNAKPKNTQSSETSSLPSSQKGRSGTVYQESDDEKLVEKIRGIVKDVVSGTPRSRHGTVQRIVMTTKSTTPAVVASRANTVTEVSQSKGSETVEEKKSTDDSTN